MKLEMLRGDEWPLVPSPALRLNNIAVPEYPWGIDSRTRLQIAKSSVAQFPYIKQCSVYI